MSMSDFLESFVAHSNPTLYHQRKLEEQQAEAEYRAKLMAAKMTEQLFGHSPTGSSSHAVSTFNNVKANLKANKVPYADIISKAAAKYGIPEKDIIDTIQVESNFNPNAVSPTGAQGLMQLFPAAAKDAGYEGSDMMDPSSNIMAGTSYLKQMQNRFGPNARLAYHDGPTAVAEGRPPSPEGLAYLAKFAGQGQPQQPQQVAQNDMPMQDIQEQQVGGSKFLPNPMTGGMGILGNDMDPTRRSYTEMLRNAFQSGDPQLMEFALKGLSDMQKATMQDIERTSAQKNIASTNLVPGSQEYSDLMQKAITSGGNNVNISMGDGIPKISELNGTLIDGITGEPINPPPGVPWSELQRMYPNMRVKGPTNTEQQSKDVFFGDQALNSDKLIVQNTKDANKSALAVKNLLDRIPIAGDAVNAATRQFYSDASQLLDAGTINFVAAINYKSSGANITDFEWRTAFDKYIPVAGNSEAVIKWKAKNRESMVRTMLEQVGPSGKSRLDELNNRQNESTKDPAWKPGDGPSEGLYWED